MVIKDIFVTGSEVVQYGISAGQQAQIVVIYQALTANDLIDATQTTSTLGTCISGYDSKLKDISDAFKKKSVILLIVLLH